MLLLDSKTWEFDGVTVFPDHADPNQFYYMPLAPHLSARKDASGVEFPAFSLIRFKDVSGNGGILNFDVNLGLPTTQFNSIKSAIEREANLHGDARLGPIPVVDGSVHLLMLGEDSSVQPDEGADAGGGQASGIRFVEEINHAAKPSLYGDNQAAFSVVLDEKGAIVVEKAIEGEILPIAVVYSLQYLGLRPAYHVRLDVDWDRVLKHMDESFGANMLFFSTDIGKAVDELVENRAIQFQADSFITEDADAEGSVVGRRDAAIAQVKAMITETFFQASLPPYKPGEGDQWANDLKKAADVMALVGGGPAAAQASKALFSYSRHEYQRTDRKSLNVDFSERTTVKRTIYPQGHLSGLFEQLRAPGVERSRFITSVDLDDPWFKRRRLAVFAQTDFETDKIGSINVRSRYNNEPKNAILKKGADNASFDWSSKLEGNSLHMPIEVDFEVTFEGVDSTERPRALKSTTVIEEGEQRGIDPRSLYAMSPIPITAVNFPWDRYPMVEVHTRYDDPENGLAQAELIRLQKDSEEHIWTIFVLNPALRHFEYRLIFRGADNKDHETDWTRTDDEAISVTDPFPRKRDVTVVLALDWNVVDRCFVDLTYRDPANGVDETQSLEFVTNDRSKSVMFEMQNPELKTVGYSALILTKDGRTIAIPESETIESRILIKAEMKGHRLVEIRPPAEFGRLSKATVDLRFEDFAAGMNFSNSFIFERGSGPKFFEYDYADPSRAKYERRVSYLLDNGLQQVVDWQPADDRVLQLATP